MPMLSGVGGGERKDRKKGRARKRKQEEGNKLRWGRNKGGGGEVKRKVT